VIQFRPLPVMTLLVLGAFVLLMLFGRWQWDRYERKSALEDAPVAEMTLVNYDPIEDGVQLVYGVARGGEAGWRVFAPVRYGDEIVFIDAEFISGLERPNWREVRFPASLSFGAPISGAPLRPSTAAAFTQPPRPLERLWFVTDLAAMGRAAGLEPVADYYLAIPYVGEDGRTRANPFARPAGADPLPPARHLGYALTWWGLALVLIGVYFAYHVSVGRLKFAGPRDDDGERG
jgi:surfeit locus 1 family protein